jgi:hypothetical protein
MRAHATSDIIRSDPPPPQRKATTRYPNLAQLKPGESFRVNVNVKAARQAVFRFKQKHPAGRFVVRDEGGGFARIYRLE